MNARKYIRLIILLLVLSSCKERFEPNLPVVPQGYLVVEGFINAQGPTQIKLSRTTPINEQHSFVPELNAAVSIEGDDNSSFPLSPLSNGNYASATLPINSSKKYRLRIKTSDAKEYLSDFTEVKITPAIDSVNWQQQDDGVQLYINTHDPQNKTIYYRWEYDETWEIQSAYFASYKLESINPITGFLTIRETNSSDPPIFYCWKYDTLRSIALGSSAKLDKDIIHQQPLFFIPRKDERIGIRYSIQVKQYALDKQGYQFYEQMKKNTESLGTIFDPQPSALRGNIRSVSNPNEIVIGYVSASTVQQSRIFIDARQLTGAGFNIFSMCESKQVANVQDSLKPVVPPGWPYEGIFAPTLVAYKVASTECVDCRARGGRNVRPSFW